MSTELLFAALLRLVGIRQADLARELGVARSTLASWLSGYAPMPDDAILKTHRAVNQRLQRVREGIERRAV
jgi:transcriptional regulator with XRE-family HTH domain